MSNKYTTKILGILCHQGDADQKYTNPVCSQSDYHKGNNQRNRWQWRGRTPIHCWWDRDDTIDTVDPGKESPRKTEKRRSSCAIPGRPLNESECSRNTCTSIIVFVVASVHSSPHVESACVSITRWTEKMVCCFLIKSKAVWVIKTMSWRWLCWAKWIRLRQTNAMFPLRGRV